MLTERGAILIAPGNKELTYENQLIKSTNGHAVEIYSGTDDWITFKGCTIVGVGGDGIKTGGYIRLRLINCIFRNEYGTNGGQLGRPFNLYKLRDLDIVNCEWDHGSGGLLDHTDDSGLAGNISIKTIAAKNSTKLKADGTLGQHCQFLQLSNINTLNGYKSVLVDTFQGINEYGKSAIEDGISVTSCVGTAEKPIILRNLFIRGIYADTSFTGKDFSGSAITLENGSCYVIVENWQGVDAMNAVCNIAGGHHNLITKGRAISASLQGNKSYYYWAAASVYDSDGTALELFATNKITGNVLGYNSNRTLSHFFPESGKHSICNILYANTGLIKDNWMKPEDNSYITGPITAEMEEAEYTAWKKYLTDNKLYVGATPPAADALTLSLLEAEVYGKNQIIAVNKAGEVVSFVPNSVVYKIVDPTIATIVLPTGDETVFSLTANKAGQTNVNVSLTSLKGKTIAKTFTIIVTKKADTVEKDTEAFDIQIIFSK